MPGDDRLVAAIRQLTAHAAGYARLTSDASELLAAHVERATATAISASQAQPAQFEYRFTGDAETLLVVLTCDVPPTTPRPEPVESHGVRIEWAREGTRHVCRIRQSLGPEA
jgi:hypothetical protein